MGDLMGKATGLERGDPERTAWQMLTEAPARVGRAVAAGFADFEGGTWRLIGNLAENLGIQSVADYYKHYAGEAERLGKAVEPNPKGLGFTEAAAYGGVRSIGASAPALVAGAVTTPAVSLALMGASTAGQSIKAAEAQGLSPARQLAFGAVDGVIEILTERIPATKLLDDVLKGSGVMKTVLSQLKEEIPNEQIAQFTQGLNGWAQLPENADKPFTAFMAEQPSAIAETFISTLVATVGQSGGAVAAERLLRPRSSADVVREGVGGAATKEVVAEQVAKAIETPADVRPAAPPAAPTMRDMVAPDAPSDLSLAAGITDAQRAQLEALGYQPDAMTIVDAQEVLRSGQAPAPPPVTTEQNPDAMSIEALRANERAHDADPELRRRRAEMVEQAAKAKGEKLARPRGGEAAAPAPWQMTREQFNADAAYQGVNAATDEANPSYWFTDQSTEAGEFAEAERGDPSAPAQRRTEPRIDIALRSTLEAAWAPSDRPSGSQHAYTGKEKRRPIVASIPVSAASDPHRYLVEQALQRGETVPDEVLADYPDLQQAPAPSQTTAAPTMRDLVAGTTTTTAGADRPPQWRPPAVDIVSDTAQTESDVAPAGPADPEAAGSGRRDAARRVPDRLPKNVQRLRGEARAVDLGDPTEHYAELDAAVVEAARAIDPQADPADVLEEFHFRLEVYRDQQSATQEAGRDPVDLLRRIADLGGIGERDDGKGLHGELERLRDGAKGKGGAWGRFAGMPGIFRARTFDDKGAPATGLPLDVMVQRLQQDDRFAWINSPDDLLNALDDINRDGAESADLLPGSETLRDAVGVDLDSDWWRERWRPAAAQAEASDSVAPDAADADVDFDTTALETPETDEAIQARTLQQVEADLDGYVDRYLDEHGTKLNADDASELFPEYAASAESRASRVRAVRPAASKIMEAAFQRLLREPVPAGRDKVVVFTSGGNGSGKSTTTDVDGAQAFIWDTTASMEAPTVEKIEQALAAGFDVAINHASVDPVQAFLRAVTRATGESEGRTVTIDGLVSTHRKAPQVFQALADRYRDNPRVDLNVFDNNGPQMVRRDLDWLRAQEYPTGDGLRAQLLELLDAARDEGAISDAIYRGFRGRAGEARREPSLPADPPADAAGAPRPDDRQAAEAPVAQAPDAEPAERGRRGPPRRAATPTPTGTPLEQHDAAAKAMRDGTLSLDEFRAAFARIVDQRDAITAALAAQTKADLLKRLGFMAQARYKSEKKDAVVREAYREIIGDFVLAQSFGYDPMQKDGYLNAVRAVVEKTTEADLAAYAARVAEQRAAYKAKVEQRIKAVKNPETLEEFALFVRAHKEGEAGLTPEQRKRYDELRADAGRDARAAERAKAPTVEAAGQQTTATIVETVHTRDRYPLFVVKLGDRVSREDYKRLLDGAKRMGGWYSAFRGNGAVPGFQFKSRETAEAFRKLAEAGDTTAVKEAVVERREQKVEASKSAAADRLNEMAEKMEAAGNESLGRDRQANTARRARMASGAEEIARATVAMARTIRNLAAAMENGDAKYLEGIRFRTQVDALDTRLREAQYQWGRDTGLNFTDENTEKMKRNTSDEVMQRVRFSEIRLHGDHLRSHLDKVATVRGYKQFAAKVSRAKGDEWAYLSEDDARTLQEALEKAGEKGGAWQLRAALDQRSQFRRMGITDDATLRAAMREYVQFKDGGPKKDRIKELERSLAGDKNVGFDFFPTPKPLAERIARDLDIQPGMRVLEPSAGKGNLADAVRAVQPDAVIEVVEQSSRLRDILEAKGYTLAGRDFDDFDGGPYDRIIMNPPFSNGIDADHVRRAYDLLAPGGRLMAITGEGIFFRSDAKAKAFREWFESVGGESEQMEGAFLDKTEANTTGVNSRLLTIEKPADEARTPRPLSLDSLQSEMGLSPEQAAVTMALLENMLDPRHIAQVQVVKGGTPGGDRLDQGGLFDDDADILDTGEAQPRLPGDVGAVRNEERPTPKLSDIEDEFRLTPQYEKRKGHQNTLFQTDEAAAVLPPGFWAKGLPLFQRQPQGKKGAIVLDDASALIHAFKSADVSTAVHEAAHVARRWLLNRDVPADMRQGISDEDIATAEQWAGAEGGIWNTKAEEKFARGFERYLRDGGPTLPGQIREVFAKLAGWLAEIYQNVQGSAIDVEISPEMRTVFDKLVTRVARNLEAAAPAEVVVASPKPSGPPRREDASPYKPGNPFAEKAIAARKKADSLGGQTAHERGMANAFPLGAGFGRGSQKSRDGKIDSSVNRAMAVVAATKEADYLDAQARAFDKGEIDAQGRRRDPAKQARTEKAETATDKRKARIATAKAAMEGKERWEVTKAAYADATGSLAGSARRLVESDHRGYVEQALEDGKPVPAEVLADYPDLAPKKIGPPRRTADLVEAPPGQEMNARELLDDALARIKAGAVVSPEDVQMLRDLAAEEAGANADAIDVTPQPALDRVEQAAKDRMKDRGTTDVLFQAADRQTDSAAFNRWFGGSKVVDADGKPLRVYHGTTTAKNFDRFKTPAYFTDSADSAVVFGEDAALQDVDVDAAGQEFAVGSRVIPAYLAISNPKEVSRFEDFVEWDARRRTAAERAGFDGLMLRMPDGERLFVAFRPEQIKSATGNRGTFDPKNPSILYQDTEPLPLTRDDRDDLVVIGAAKLARGLDRAAWDAAMRREFGPKIAPLLKDLHPLAAARAKVAQEVDVEEYFNLRRLDVSDAEKQEVSAAILESIYRTGRVPKERESWEQIRAEAKEMAPEVLEQLKPFQEMQAPFRAVRLIARERIAALNQEIYEGRLALEGFPGDSPEALQRERTLAAKERDLQGLLDVWMRQRSEDGRNLAMHRMTVNSLENWYDPTFWYSKARRELGLPVGTQLPEDVWRALRDILDRGRRAVENGQPVEPIQLELSRYLTRLQKSTWLEVISAVRKAGLLTGPKTHARNVLGNLAFATLEELSRIPAVVIDFAVGVVTGHRTVHGISARAVARASREAATKGLHEARDILRSGSTASSLMQVDARRELNSGIRWLDTYVNTVFRTMGATDRIFKSYAFRRSMEEQAALEAINRGVSPIELLANPPAEMLARAVADAEFATFNNKNVMAEFVTQGKNALRRHPGQAGKVAAFAIDMTVPFVNTPSNILARMIDYTPGGATLAISRAAIQVAVNKGLTAEQQRIFAQGIGRGATGSALIYLGYMLAAAGMASGMGGDDEGDRNVKEAAGVLPGAVRIGGRWHQIATFSPAGNLVSLGASIYRSATMPLKDELLRGTKIAAVAARLALDQPMLKGMSDLIASLQRPEARAEAFAAGMAGSFVPTFVNDLASAFDPYRRDTRPEGGFRHSLWTGVAARLPGARNLLPARLTVLGDTQAQTTRAIWDPTIASIARDLQDDVLRELVKHDVGITWPRQTKDETAAAYRQRVVDTGAEIKARVGRLIDSPRYRQRGAAQQAELIGEEIEDARRRVRERQKRGGPPMRPRFQ